MNMLGLRDLVLIAPTPSSLHRHHNQGVTISERHTHTPNLPLPSSAASLSVGFGIFPLLSATPCLPHPQTNTNDEVQKCGGVVVANNTNTTNNNYWNLKMCQELNNPPKKGVINNVVGGSKRTRALLGSSQNATATSHSSNSNATTPNSLATTSFHQDDGFKQSLPGHVRAAAEFKCHRVSSIEDGEDEFAYLATVHISGHVFKGFLYDHGVDANAAVLGNNCSGKNRECSSAIGVANNNAFPHSAS